MLKKIAQKRYHKAAGCSNEKLEEIAADCLGDFDLGVPEITGSRAGELNAAVVIVVIDRGDPKQFHLFKLAEVFKEFLSRHSTKHIGPAFDLFKDVIDAIEGKCDGKRFTEVGIEFNHGITSSFIAGVSCFKNTRCAHSKRIDERKPTV